MFIEYKINEEIYPVNVIHQAINDFIEVANIKYEEGILKIFWDSEEEINEIFNEFINYCIALINEK